MLIERDAPSLATIAARIARRQLSPVEVTATALDRLAQHEPTLNAFITTLPDEALAAAREAEVEIARGDYRGPLHGVPILIKDNIASMDEMNTTGELHLLISLCAVTDISISRIIRTTRS